MYVRTHKSFESWVVSTQKASGYLMLPTEGDAEVIDALFYGRRGVGYRNLKDAPVGVTLIETTHQKHQGVGFSRCVCGAPPASEEVAQPGGKPLDRQALLRRQLCLELR